MAVKSYADLKEKVLAMSSFFETSSGYPTTYGVTSGNWDGQGMSFGCLQLNLGTGSLQPYFNYMNTNYNQLCRDTFGTNYDEWNTMLGYTTANQVAWADGISVDGNGRVKGILNATWKPLFQALGETQPSIDKQIEMSASWLPNAEKFFNELGLWSRRGFALCWDISVQMGRLTSMNLIWNDFQNIDTTGKTREQIEIEKLNIILDRSTYHNRVTTANQQLVFDRNNMLITGSGSYYGTPFDMAQYDLEYEPAFEYTTLRGVNIG
jgi:hypothetical protein